MRPATLISSPSVSPGVPRRGDYLCSERALYRVERVFGDRALIEDCRTESLIDISIAELMLLKPVRLASGHD
jgi:hypothetical protein